MTVSVYTIYPRHLHVVLAHNTQVSTHPPLVFSRGPKTGAKLERERCGPFSSLPFLHPFPLFSLHHSSLPLLLLTFSFLPLPPLPAFPQSGPSNSARGSGERCKAASSPLSPGGVRPPNSFSYVLASKDKKLSYRRETARQLHTSFSAHSLIVRALH